MVFEKIVKINPISAWKSKGLSDKSIKSPATSNNSLILSLDYFSARTRVNFDGQCFKQDIVTSNQKNIVNINIALEINL